MGKVSVSGQFIQGAKGPIFVLVRKPQAAVRGCVLVVPPFAEEMNKSRRMTTVTALALAKCGIATVVPDVHGTGDSGGEFEEADWSTWLTDLACVARWCGDTGCAVTGALAIRLGAALAASAFSASMIAPVATSVLWQPIFDGRRWLTQFLRLRIAAALAEQDRKETMRELLGRLRAGEVIEVAGYRLSARLAMDIDASAPPEVLPTQLGAVHWFEVIREPGTALSTAATQYGERAHAAAQRFVAQTAVGDPFWGSTEIVLNESLIAATVAAFAQSS